MGRLVVVCSIWRRAANDAEGELNQPGNTGDGCKTGRVVGANHDGFAFRPAKGLVARAVDSDGLNFGFWAGGGEDRGHLADVYGREAGQQIDNISVVHHGHGDELG